METLNGQRLTYSVLYFLTIAENFGHFFALEHWSNFDLAFLKLTKSYRSAFPNAISREPDFSQKIWEISHPEHSLLGPNSVTSFGTGFFPSCFRSGNIRKFPNASRIKVIFCLNLLHSVVLLLNLDNFCHHFLSIL